MKVSVALAAYNGEKYIQEQIASVLENLGPEDELIISDDGSTDKTLELVRGFSDQRIVVVNGPKAGVKKNFENAIAHCSGDIIFLCDQDDVWKPEKVRTVLEVFEKEKAMVVVHNCSLEDDQGKVLLESYFDFRKSGPGVIKNLLKNSYMGCCMAFDASLKETVLPVPEDIEMHDQWIGILGDRKGKNVFIDDRLIVYRRHENNVSDCFNHYGFMKMLTNRIHLFFRLITRKIK